MSEIKEITEAQLKKIPEYVEKWKMVTLCKKNTDEEKAVLAINAMYDNAKLARPRHIIFLESPLGCFLACVGMIRLIKTRKLRGMQRFLQKVDNDSLNWWSPGEDKIVGKAYVDAAKALENCVNNYGIPRDSMVPAGRRLTQQILTRSSWGCVIESDDLSHLDSFVLGGFFKYGRDRWQELTFVFSGLWGNPGESNFYIAFSRTLDRYEFLSAVEDGISIPFISGYHPAFYEYCRDVLSIQDIQDMQPILDVAKECGCLMPYTNVCFVSRKPEAIHLDEGNRSHNFGGQALEYGDGWGIWAINGVRMPKKFANEMPENWKSEWLLETGNAEQRRVIMRVIGYSKILRDLGAKQIHLDGDMSLHKIDRDVDVEDVYLLKVNCPSTGTSYALRVPPHVKTCEEGRMALMRNSKGLYTFQSET